MTSKSSRWNKPFRLLPAAKDYLWGGVRLNTDFGKAIDITPLAETWECSVHPDGLSFADNGIFSGASLEEILHFHPEFLGTVHESLPILVKLIDAQKDLSVQVHPSDEYAFHKENGSLGKTEMWYVLDAEKDASLVYGLKNKYSKEEIRKAVVDGSIEECLRRIPVKKNDVFFIEPGTIHAIGAGCLIAEVQESSNLTYRLYDYGRPDKRGIPRELHIDKALDVANLNGDEIVRQPMRVLRYRPGCAQELLCKCRYFEVYRMLLNTERNRDLVGYAADETSFRVLLCIEGCGSLETDGEVTNFFKGDCIFFPASSKARLHGHAQCLDIRG